MTLLRTRLAHRVTVLTARCSLVPALAMRVAHALRARSLVLYVVDIQNRERGERVF